MDQGSAPDELGEATPIFSLYRRGGYDPDQVDRYVADQHRRLDDTLHRATEAERKLAAAVGQLRELHRRIAVLENQERSAQPQPPPLDTLGERVQRILQEAWEGAYALRQNAEQEALEQRERAATEAEDIIATARRKAQAMDEEIERRRRAYLERVEEDRSRAVAQITYLHEQRKIALGELLRVKENIEATVGDVVAPRPGVAPAGATPRSSRPAATGRTTAPTGTEPGRPGAKLDEAEPDQAALGARGEPSGTPDARELDAERHGAPGATRRPPEDAPVASRPLHSASRPRARDAQEGDEAGGPPAHARPADADERPTFTTGELARTMPVHRLEATRTDDAGEPLDASELVRSHRERAEPREAGTRRSREGAEDLTARQARRAGVFDFEKEQPT
ncbi:MAG TPA: hypothetical protein VMU75_05055 [Acidimicrobiales bacterium]|nr:hypothetical protein [Acidimicrobiales bacterium]